MKKTILPLALFLSFNSAAVSLDIKDMNLQQFADVVSTQLDKTVIVDSDKYKDKTLRFKANIKDEHFKFFLKDYLRSQDLFFYEREHFYYIDDEDFSKIQYKDYQVNVSAIISETQLNNLNQYNIDFSASGLSYETMQSPSSGLSVSKITGGYELLLDFLKTNSNTEILSNPELTVKHQEQAIMQVGQNVPILKSRRKSQEGNLETQEIERVDVGLLLDILPVFIDNETVSLRILNEVSNVSESNVASDIILNKKQISTTAIAKNSEILHIGGLIDNSKSVIKSETPFFSKMPLLGKLFDSETIKDKHTRLDIFIKIEIIKPSKT